VNIESWIVALCKYNVDTYIPVYWMRKYAKKPAVMGSKVKIVAELYTTNMVVECNDFFRALETISHERGIHIDRSCAAAHSHSLEVLDKMSVIQGLAQHEHSKESSYALKKKLEVSVLDVDEINGLLSRGGRVVVANIEEWSVAFGIESNDEPFKLYENIEALPFDIRGPDDCSVWTATIINSDTYTSVGGIAVEALIYAELMAGKSCTFNFASRILDELFKQGLSTESKTAATHVPQIVRKKSGLVEALCQSVKRIDRAVIAATPISSIAVVAVTTKIVQHVDVIFTTRCRNAWLFPCGSSVEAMDKVLRRAVFSRKAWTTRKRCAACPIEHPDNSVTSTRKCRSKKCKRRFEMCTTMSHYAFRNGRGKRFELDTQLPLFVDEALSALHDFELQLQPSALALQQ